MKFEFAPMTLLEIKNFMEPETFERYKKSLASLMFTQRATVFDKEGGASGAWAKLSSKHEALRMSKVPKNKRGKPGAIKILQDTGALRQSFTPESGPGSSQKIEETQGDQVRIATNVEYAAIHNFGGVINRPTADGKSSRPITIPARPFDEFSEQDLDEINELTEQFVYG
jgi:phage gpG-like protein